MIALYVVYMFWELATFRKKNPLAVLTRALLVSDVLLLYLAVR